MATTGLEASTSRTTGVSAQSIATGDNYLGSEIDNSTNLDEFCSIEILGTPAVAPTAEDPLMVYIVYAIDGTNYEDGDATPTDPKKAPVAVLLVKASTNAQKIATLRVPLAPHKFKILVRNEADQSVTTTVLCRTYNKTVA